MVDAKRRRGARIWLIVLLALLVIQYELGMAVNISNPPQIPPVSLAPSQFNAALGKAGTVAMIHASVGILVGLIAILNLILALRSHIRSVQVFGSLTFLAVLIAGIMGLSFVRSGFQNDGFSHGMATNFILSFIFSFLELYFLKPSPRNHAG